MEFVWVLFSGSDDKWEGSRELEDIYASKSKARKHAKEIMDRYSRAMDDSWWEKKVSEDGITWHWFYEYKGVKKGGGDYYVEISKFKVK